MTPSDTQIRIDNKKVVLCERKRFIVRCVASTSSVLLSYRGGGGGGYPIPGHPWPGWGTHWKGHGTSGSIMGWRWGTPPWVWTDWRLWKQYLPIVLRTRAVITEKTDTTCIDVKIIQVNNVFLDQCYCVEDGIIIMYPSSCGFGYVTQAEIINVSSEHHTTIFITLLEAIISHNQTECGGKLKNVRVPGQSPLIEWLSNSVKGRKVHQLTSRQELCKTRWRIKMPLLTKPKILLEVVMSSRRIFR